MKSYYRILSGGKIAWAIIGGLLLPAVLVGPVGVGAGLFLAINNILILIISFLVRKVFPQRGFPIVAIISLIFSISWMIGFFLIDKSFIIGTITSCFFLIGLALNKAFAQIHKEPGTS